MQSEQVAHRALSRRAVPPATFPQDALTTCQRAIWHPRPRAVLFHRSLQLPPRRGLRLPRQQPTGRRRPLEGGGSRANSPSCKLPDANWAEKLYRTLHSLARVRAVFSAGNSDLISRRSAGQRRLRLPESSPCARHCSKCSRVSLSLQPYRNHLQVENEETEYRHLQITGSRSRGQRLLLPGHLTPEPATF